MFLSGRSGHAHRHGSSHAAQRLARDSVGRRLSTIRIARVKLSGTPRRIYVQGFQAAPSNPTRVGGFESNCVCDGLADRPALKLHALKTKAGALQNAGLDRAMRDFK